MVVSRSTVARSGCKSDYEKEVTAHKETARRLRAMKRELDDTKRQLQGEKRLRKLAEDGGKRPDVKDSKSMLPDAPQHRPISNTRCNSNKLKDLSNLKRQFDSMNNANFASKSIRTPDNSK